MKLQKPDISVEGSEPIISKEYSIRPGDMGMLLEILRKKMYRDPIRAIVREITCNARDAHTEIGTPDKPIEIILPTQLSKQLQIRDYGPGINARRMWDIFIHYGASTKRRDNKQIGGFGLGAKTPFAYGDSFSVVSIHGGKKRHYTAIIDETQRGRMNLVAEASTDEPTGTTIIIPINDIDNIAFAHAVIEQTKYFPVRPIVKGLPPGIEFPPEKPIFLEGDNWKFFVTNKKQEQWDSRYYAKIIIDGVGYPITPADLNVNVSTDYKWINSLLQQELHIYFKVGKLALTANRDSIHFDENTQKVILDRLQKIFEKLLENGIKKLQNLPNLLEAEVFWNEFSNKILPNKHEPEWNGFKLQGILRKKESADLVDMFYYEWANNKLYTRSAHELILSNKLEYFIDDSDFGARSLKKRIGTYINEHDDITGAFVIKFNSNATKEKWMKEYGLKHFKQKHTSILPTPTRKSRNGSGKRGVNRPDFDVWVYDSGYYGSKTCENNWRPTTLPKKCGNGVYVECLSRREVIYKSGDWTFSLNDHNNFTVIEKLIGQCIYAIPTRSMHLLGSAWTPLDQIALPMLETIANKYSQQEIDAANKVWHTSFYHVYQYSEPKWEWVASNLPDKNLLVRYIKVSDELKTLQEAQKQSQIIRREFGDKLTLSNNSVNNSVVEEVEQVYELLYDNYPLLKYIARANEQEILEYIRLIDETKTKNKTTKLGDNPQDYCAVA